MTAAKQRKKALDEEWKMQKKIFDAALKALDDEIDRYKKIIDAKKKSLDLTKEAREYEQTISEKTLAITEIQDRLAEIAFNDSLEARAERFNLEKELTKQKLDLDNYVFDNEIKNQKEALDSEYERWAESKKLEKELIQSNLDAAQEAHDARIQMIENELEAYQNSINIQIEGLKAQGQEYDRQAENVQAQIQSIQDSIANNGELTRKAMARIDAEGEALYKKLIEWNNIYGTGIEEDIAKAWEQYLRIVDIGNETTLEYTRRILREILDLTQQIASIQSNISSATVGVRQYLTDFGYNVDWNPNTGNVLVDGKEYSGSSSAFDIIDNHYYGTQKEIEDMLKELGLIPHAEGAFVKTDHPAVVHAGERILRPIETTDLHTLLPRMFDIQNMNNRMLEKLNGKNINTNINSNTPTQITQHNTLKIDGVATDQIVKNLDEKFDAFGNKIISKINRAVKDSGGKSAIRAY